MNKVERKKNRNRRQSNKRSRRTGRKARIKELEQAGAEAALLIMQARSEVGRLKAALRARAQQDADELAAADMDRQRQDHANELAQRRARPACRRRQPLVLV